MDATSIPSQQDIDAAVSNARHGISHSLVVHARVARWARAGGALAAAGVLFAGGIVVGGATSVDTVRATSDLTMECYVTGAIPVLGGTIPALYTPEQIPNPRLAVTRADPLASCDEGYSGSRALEASDAIVSQHILSGTLCGYVTFTDSSRWGFQADRPGDPRFKTWVPDPAPGSLGTDCVILTIPAEVDRTFSEGLACAVDDAFVRVFAGAPADVGTCESHGLTKWTG